MPKTKRNNKKKKNAKTSRGFRIVCWCVAAVLFFCLIGGVIMRREKCSNADEVRIFLPTGSTYDDVVDTLLSNGCISARERFDAMSRFRRYTNHVKAGSYVVDAHMPYYDLVNKLRAGNQDAIRIVIGRQRSMETMCQNLGKRFEFSGKQLYQLVSSDSVCHRYGLTRPTMMSLFVQNSYDLYWNTSPERFLDRMEQEHNRFWNSSRISKCDALKLTPAEVTTLASIVEEETNDDSEKPLIASVYLNRIRCHMPLQADPTVRYAIGDFSIRRVLKSHTLVNSPYNTYRNAGLPPGPICIPSTASIDAVLTNRKTDFLYFCAKEDFSGSHNFASTLAEHQRNAEKFHNALNNRKIYK